MALNNTQLQNFCQHFLGYGNPKASLWFIGMEEGGGNSEGEIVARFAAWEKRGERSFEDMKALCTATGHADLLAWGSSNAPYQKTWCALIKQQGERENKPALVNNPVVYQRTEWLTENGETCLLNLMPLPSKGIDSWQYGAWSDLPALRTRKLYTDAFVDARIMAIREAILEHRPKQVIFFGLSNREYWNRIKAGITELTGTAFDLIEHPAARNKRESGVSTRSSMFDSAQRTATLSSAGKGKDMTKEEYKVFFQQIYDELGLSVLSGSRFINQRTV